LKGGIQAALADLNVYLVDDLDTAQEFMRWLGERRPVLAIDTETTGLKWWTPNFLRLAQFGDGKTGWAIPAHRWLGLIDTALKQYDGPVAYANAKFDQHTLESAGLPLPAWRNVDDVLTMDHLLDSSKPHALKSVAVRLYGQEARAGQGMLQSDFRKHGWWWDTVPYDWPAYWAYAALDTVLTARVHEDYKPIIDATYATQYEEIMAYMEIMYGAENRGMGVDEGYTVALRDQWAEEMSSLLTTLEEYSLENPNSNQQVEAALRASDPLWVPEEWTDSGQAKMDKDVLTKLGGEIGPKVLRYRRLRKWSTAYLSTFLDNRGADGRLHPNVRVLGARTGRDSITDPAMQTLPRGNEIRNCIIPAPGKRLVTVDYDTMEYRVFASFANAEAIIAAINEGVDLHKMTAAMAYNITMDQVSKAQRQISKNTAYGRIYGAGAAKIATTASAPDTDGSFTLVTTEEVEKFLDGFDKKIPEVATFMQQVEQIARQRMIEEGQPYIRTVGGRRIPSSPEKMYALVNYLIQGSCADVFHRKVIELANHGYEDFIVLPVHDEVIFEIPTDDYDDLAPEFERIMRDDTTFNIPLTVAASPPLERWQK
jgi:DNA polymerase-1